MDTRGSNKILQQHMLLLQEMLATPLPAVKQETTKKQTLCHNAQHCAQTLMFCPCPCGQWCRFPTPELFQGDWTWPKKPMRFCVSITRDRAVVKEAEEQLNRDDSYSLWEQVLGFNFNCYHLPHLSQYSQAWGPINIIKEWKSLWVNIQIQARKLFQYIMMPLAALLQAAWVGPEQPLPLQLWVQEGVSISPEQKAEGSSGFRDHLQRRRWPYSYLLTS